MPSRVHFTDTHSKWSQAILDLTGLTTTDEEVLACPAPEKESGPPADVYALGFILAWLLDGAPPEPSFLLEGTGDPSLRVFIAEMLEPIPEARPTAAAGVSSKRSGSSSG